jgi:hypothetical protein
MAPRFSIGYNLRPAVRSNYWLDDPWAVSLPPAYIPYRWVRYCAVVNIYDGQGDVIYNFFW